jgi:SAM-dependent methyltransferase
MIAHSGAMADTLFADAYLAGLYDIWHPRSVRDDYDFYLPHIMAAEAVLDAGCGTGTLLHDARGAGHIGRLVGLDPAEAMLALARRRTDIEWVLGDLQSAAWDGAFDLVVMTGHAFQAIIADEDLRGAVAAVRRALKPGGRFAFETRNPAARAWERWRPENAATIIDAEGRPVRITTEVVAPFDGETVSFIHTFTGGHPSLPQVSRSTLRFLDPAALQSLLTEAGLRVEQQFGDFDGRPLTPDSAEIITFARAV